MAAAKIRKATTDKKEEPLPTDITSQEVLTRLGKPNDLYKVDVHRYDTSRCRVNIRRNLNKEAAEEHYRALGVPQTDRAKIISGISCSFDKTITVITDSFYLRTNYDGSLRNDNEQILQKYK
jgi:hypothetical protein